MTIVRESKTPEIFSLVFDHAQATVTSSSTKGGKITARASDHANILPFVLGSTR